MDVKYLIKGGLRSMGYHKNGKIRVYVKPHLIQAMNVKDLINEIIDTEIHEYLHYLNDNLNHNQIYSVIRAMNGDNDFKPKYNIIEMK